MSDEGQHFRPMLLRFCLYGFLKNQRYYDPFLILFFREAGLDFFAIGLLVGYRELLTNIFEVPSGAVADIYGRRKCMVFSLCVYIASFFVFAFSAAMWHFFAAMSLFALGEAFRTGTHKAMIFGYLLATGRSDEKTAFYGRTRSFSKLGSAVSIVVAAGVVFLVSALKHGPSLAVYRYLFLASILPYVAGLINLAGYPDYLDKPAARAVSVRKVFGHLFSVARDSFRTPVFRGLLVESIGFQGTYKVAKDYLQPIVKYAALSLPLLAGLEGIRRTAALILVVYVALHLLESLASRRSDAVRTLAGGNEPCAKFLWLMNVVVFAVIALGLGLNWLLNTSPTLWALAITMGGFLALAALQNLWRPLQISRFNTAIDEANTATVLSIESQVRSLSAAVIAPVLGLAVDLIGSHAKEAEFIPVALLGLVGSAAILVFARFRAGPPDR